jgi:hypothetical protein
VDFKAIGLLSLRGLLGPREALTLALDGLHAQRVLAGLCGEGGRHHRGLLGGSKHRFTFVEVPVDLVHDRRFLGGKMEFGVILLASRRVEVGGFSASMGGW